MNIYLVYQKYNKEFIAYAKSITQNSDRAFDLVQEAYVSALEREEMFANMNEHQIKGWFFTTIKNRNIDFIRKQNKILPCENVILNNVLSKESQDFESQVTFDNLIQKLPRKNKEILVLKYKMLLNSTEIGEILGISPSTVRSRLSASLKMLKNEI
ncbi:RNA polymerase sigma-70 factor, ECF subfamily [Caloranaerobacter azorensis DSM 13643]|uniref:RNA polymerase sigma-70 factor, ECF subfamily n=1 Tax=Caloranaerobacter azorensis DSM 13643 TaxID=1121264 RepID=A0A1M5UPP4_9FIRM|nr:sigma-70 family RNA polymerase sigma factor [Caloranaerobacter azorensis]SHH64613.1 RNA polymerase sigma-70 factor, ECF subfamily [Caloranaerobacter azorensis DSM 13643]